MAQTALPSPSSGGGFRIKWWMIVIAVVVLALVAFVGFTVIRTLEGDQNNFLWQGGNSVLNFLFNPDARVDQSQIVQCRAESGCSTIQAFIYGAILLFTVITGFAYTTLLERKFIAWFQSRVGPNRVGPLGLLQPAADAVKLITKEDITPSGASKAVWYLAPMIKCVPVLIVLAVIPLGPDLVIPWFDGRWYQVPLSLADPSVGILWILGITSLGTYGIALAGWASNNKYAMLGGLRSSAQMISYELSLGLTMAVPVMIVGSMSLGDIADAQPMIWNWFLFQNPIAAGVLFIALLAEVSRAPFDLPEAEQELTGGFFTEYSGMKFALFMMAEYLGMIAISMVVITLYLGGYQDGFGLVDSVPILGPLVMIGKVILLLIFMVWIRATLPRIRYDRLMAFGWKVLIPLSLIAVMWTAVALVVGDLFQSPVAYGIVSGILFVGIAAFGYFMLRREGETAARLYPSIDQPADPADDPIITGEQRGIGYGILNVVGVLIAVPFALVEFLTRQIEKLREIGDDSDAAPVQSTALTLVKPVAAAPVAPPSAAPAAAEAAPPPAPKPAAAAEKPAPAAGGAKAKFDKEAMLAKIREKKAK
jgi:NADH-quinone oxidoreductase subunit H